MRERLKRSFRGELRLLRLTLTRFERLDYVCSEWLADGPGDLFLPFAYEGQVKGATLNYDVLGTQRLSSFAKASVSLGQYEGMLRAICDVCDVCISKGIPTSSLWLDPDGVFVTPESSLRFVLVPLAGSVTPQHGSPLALLAWLGSPANVRMVVEDDVRYVRVVGDWAQRQSVFAPENFSRFLAEELPASASCGKLALPDDGHGNEHRAALTFAHGEGASRPRPAVRQVGALNPLELLGEGTVRFDPPTAAERLSRALYEAVPEADTAQEKVLGDTSSLGSGSLGFSGGEEQHTISHERQAPLCVERLRDGLRLELSGGEQVLGRSATCELHFGGNPSVSRCHASVTADGDGGGVTLIDLGTANGTFVREHRVAPHVPCHVKRGEEFLLANERFRVV